MSEEKKIKEIVEELKDGKENPTFIYPTFDGSDEEEFENDKLLTPSSCALLFDYITQLETNWNELKKFVQEELKDAEDDFAEEDFIKVLDRMQELENKNE
jgi:hypothetical protein